MKKNFNFELVNGFKGTMNNVNEVAQFVKAELLNTNNVVKVNGFRFSIGGVEGAEGYALYVETNDGNPKPWESKTYVHKFYYLGKIRRGIDKYVADFLTNYAKYGWDEPKYVWRDGKMVDIDEVVEENEYDVIENLVDGFNKEIEEMIDGIYNETCVNAVYNAEICNDTENEYVCAFMNWDIDIEDRWYIYVEEWAGDEYLDVAMKYYNDWENRRIYDEDGICEYVGNAYGEYIEDNCCGSCLVYVKNPYYVAEDSPKNDAPCLDEIVENALESAMDDGNEYYDDKICQVGELYVSYTSPCDEFPKGCVCVVDDEGRMYGNWCNVSDSGFAVDFLVKTLEKYNKEFNRVA